MSARSSIAQAGNSLDRSPLVHISDSDLKVCEALSLVVRLEGFRSSFSTSAEEFEASVARHPPHAAVINAALPPAGPAQAIGWVLAASPGASVYFLQDVADVTGAVECMQQGAADVLVKPIDTEHLVRSLRSGFRRDVHLGARAGGFRRVHITGFATLTERERQVLDLVVNGSSNREASVELGISARTVEVHRSSAMRKLGAANTADLVRKVMQAGGGH